MATSFMLVMKILSYNRSVSEFSHMSSFIAGVKSIELNGFDDFE